MRLLHLLTSLLVSSGAPGQTCAPPGVEAASTLTLEAALQCTRVCPFGDLDEHQMKDKPTRLRAVQHATVEVGRPTLFDAFKSFRNALLILANIPFALIGGLVALSLTSILQSVLAAIGLIARFGQAVLKGVVVVTHAVGAETQRPLTVVVIGHLGSATALTLLVPPTFYIWFARREGVMHEHV